MTVAVVRYRSRVFQARAPHTHAHAHAHARAHAHTRARRRMRPHVHAPSIPRMHARTHTCSHMCTHPHMHTRTHVHALARTHPRKRTLGPEHAHTRTDGTRKPTEAAGPWRQSSRTVARTSQRRSSQVERAGLCSTWLATLQPGDAVRAHVRRGALRLGLAPAASATAPPVILIGPGTGVAPLRAFIQERHGLVGAVPVAVPEPPTEMPSGNAEGVADMLFFGCRRRADDWLYRDEWVQYAAAGACAC
jgi:hypothetical protein